MFRGGTILRISYVRAHVIFVRSDTAARREIQLRKGCIELATLASLWPGRLYGLELLRRIEQEAGLVVKEGTIYPLLGRLERAGLIEAEWVESRHGHPRKYYTLTRDGAHLALEMTRRWLRFTRNLERLLTPVAEALRSSPDGTSGGKDRPE